MALAREALYVALLAKLVGATTWKTPPTRRLPDGAPPPNDQQPTAFLLEAEREMSELQTRGLPLLWTLHPAIAIYARTDDPTVAPSTTTNALITAVELALEQGAGDQPVGAFGSPTSLGGLTLRCRILEVHTGAGHQNGQAVVELVLEVKATAGGPP